MSTLETGTKPATTTAPSAAAAAQPITTTEQYAQLMRRHRTAQEQRRQQAATALTDLQQATDTAVSQLAQRSSERIASASLLAAERRVDDQLRELHATSLATQQRLTHWGQAFAGFQAALKDLGDVANWSAAIESDVRDAVNILDCVVKAKARAVQGQ